MPASRYYVAGKRVPGVTSGVTGQLGWGKEGLIRWANNIGLDGKTLEEGRKKADVGTVAHAVIQADMRGETVDLSKIDDEMSDTVGEIFERWKRWKALRVERVLLCEEELVSESMLFGGRPDMVVETPEGETWLVDVKTGGLYANHLVQVAAYAMLVEEATDHRIDVLALLRIPQDSTVVATCERPYERDGVEVETVRICRRLHAIEKQLRSEV